MTDTEQIELVATLREVQRLLRDKWGHADAKYEPVALEALALIDQALASMNAEHLCTIGGSFFDAKYNVECSCGFDCGGFETMAEARAAIREHTGSEAS